MDAVCLKELTKVYRDVTAVDCLSLSIREGECFALLGVNGAGKSTTIRVLCGLTPPTSGDALIHGHSIAREPERAKALIGVSPQETAVAPALSVWENLTLMCGVQGLSRGAARERAERLCEQFGLREQRDRRAGKLSGGWQRRLSIAMALAGEPRVLFLDEPTLGLDVLARSELWDVIRSLKGRATVVLTTHYMEEAEQLSDRVGVMQSGRLLALGTAAELRGRAQAATLEEAFVALVKGGVQG